MYSCKKFKAEMIVFNGHHTSIRKGFNAYCNCGSIKTPVRFINVQENENDKGTARSGDKKNVEIEFTNHQYFIAPDTPIFLREGRLRAYARIIDAL